MRNMRRKGKYEEDEGEGEGVKEKGLIGMKTKGPREGREQFIVEIFQLISQLDAM